MHLRTVRKEVPVKRKLSTIATLAIIISACGGSGDGATTTAAPVTTAAVTTTEGVTTTEAVTTTVAGVTVTVATTDLGTILVDGEGRTLYIFTPDTQGDPTCAGDCAVNWPPLTEAVTAGDGLDPALLGTAAGGHVTYNDWPLYYFAADANPGDVNGQGVGGVWYVIDAAGNPVE